MQAQQAHALPYAKVVGCPGTESYQAPSPDPTTHENLFLPYANNKDADQRVHPHSLISTMLFTA